ncbi:unnamed protein product [Sphagnum balticum]
MLVDLNSSHGTAVVRAGREEKLEPLRPFSLEKGDMVVFGLSSRREHVRREGNMGELFCDTARRREVEAPVERVAGEMEMRWRNMVEKTRRKKRELL